MKQKAKWLALLPLFTLLTSCSNEQLDQYPTTVFRPEFYSYRMWVFYGLLMLGSVSLLACLIMRIAGRKTIFKDATVLIVPTILGSLIQFAIGVAFCLIGIFVPTGYAHYIAFFCCWIILCPATTFVRDSTMAFHKATSFFFLAFGAGTLGFLVGFLFIQNGWLAVLYAFSPIYILCRWAEAHKAKRMKEAFGTIFLQLLLNIVSLIFCGWITFVCFPWMVAFVILYILHFLVITFSIIFIH